MDMWVSTSVHALEAQCLKS